MKRLLFAIALFFLGTSVDGQFKGNDINGLVKALSSGGRTHTEIRQLLNGIIKDPELYNDAWKKFLDLSFIKDNSRFNLLRDLHIKFKTFQTEDQPLAGLGFAYDFKFDFAKYSEQKARVSQSLGFAAEGNVAFKKILNPNDFLESKFHYTLSFFKGGVLQTQDTAVFSQLNELDDQLSRIKDMQSAEALALWDQHGQLLVLSNQFYWSVAPKFALESNQDFTKKQFTPGAMIGLGVKAWNTRGTLSKLNVLDYPFALIRVLTGTDKKFTPYGSTLPTVQLAFDYVIPTEDQEREQLVNNTDPFPRFKFETGFRTFISRVKKENIFFSANLRHYRELNAKQAIKTAKLDQHTYFVMALQSTTGLYVSYAKGKLPFDAKKDEVYALGFNYKF